LLLALCLGEPFTLGSEIEKGKRVKTKNDKKSLLAGYIFATAQHPYKRLGSTPVILVENSSRQLR